MSKVKKIIRRIIYDNNTERESVISFDEDDNPRTQMGQAGIDEWTSLYNWYDERNLLHLLDMTLLRDHCLAVSRGKRVSAVESFEKSSKKDKKDKKDKGNIVDDLLS